MSAERSPAFQFYPLDWLGDSKVLAMTLEARGAYMHFLCICWRDALLPLDPVILARLLGLTVPAFERRIWPQLHPCFTWTPDGWTQKRIERERVKQVAFREAASRAGKASAAARYVQRALNERSTDVQQKLNSSSSSLVQIQEPPISPFPRGTSKITKRERQKAEKHRADADGGCRHDPPCESYRACVELIAMELRGVTP
jgi:uncharacterized protein YdaU (DUF1376 family)